LRSALYSLSLHDALPIFIARARGIRQGLETELSLAVDVMFPSSVLARVLHDFQAVFPTVDLRLNIEALGAVAALVFDGRADLAIDRKSTRLNSSHVKISY